MHPADVRVRAIGPTTGLPEPLARALDPTPFVPLPSPGPADWLASHPEPGQGYVEFVASRPPRPDARRRRIDLLPLGRLASGPPLERFRDYATTFYGLPSRLLPALDAAALSPTSRINPQTGRRQLFTPEILDALAGRIDSGAFCLAALTLEDLYPDPAWNFVFGQASLSERVGVYSLARYDPAFYGEARGPGWQQTVLRRGLNVMVHELGHMLGFAHCVFFRCVMNGSNHLDEADARPMQLCPVCLRKLHHSIPFDPLARYRGLEAYYRGAGLGAEAERVAALAARIARP